MRKSVCLATTAAAALAAFTGTASAQTLQAVPFGGQTYDAPYHVAGVPADGSRVLVVEAAGTIRMVKDGVTQAAPFLDIGADVLSSCGECGLFSIALAPDYPSTGLIYVFYARDASPGEHYLRIEEFRRSTSNPDLADPASRRIVLEIPHTGAANHNGGQLQFGPDGLLYIWVGDGGASSATAQQLSTTLGKLLRIDPRGAAPFAYSIPADNPFADGAGPNADEIYSYGLRNPWRGSFDRSTGDLTIGDVGAGAVEEIDFKLEGGGRGANFGWDCFEGTLVNSGCPVPNHSPPVHQYPNPPLGAAAIAGGFVIRDSALPGWSGRYIYTDSYTPDLRTIDPKLGSSSDSSLGLGGFAFPVSFGQDACGHIYIADAGTGQVSRLEPAGAPFPCKLGPKLSVDTERARHAARHGAVLLGVGCDEDCDLVANAVIRIKRRRGFGRGGKKAAAAKAIRLRPRPAAGSLELESPGSLRLDLSRKQTRRLRKALRRGRRAVARIEVSASGGGGGTDTAVRKVRQRAKKRKAGRAGAR